MVQGQRRLMSVLNAMIEAMLYTCQRPGIPGLAPLALFLLVRQLPVANGIYATKRSLDLSLSFEPGAIVNAGASEKLHKQGWLEYHQSQLGVFRGLSELTAKDLLICAPSQHVLAAW